MIANALTGRFAAGAQGFQVRRVVGVALDRHRVNVVVRTHDGKLQCLFHDGQRP